MSTPPPSPISGARLASGPLLFVSGQIALGADGQVAHPGDAGAQADMALAQIGAILDAYGCGFDAVVKLTTFLVDMGDLDQLRAARARVFSGAPPAATTVEVAALARPGLLVEIEAIAELPG